MPAGVLTPDLLTGFHGKLPAAGDFVSRGLPTGFVAFWDGWATRHLARREGWPEGGLRLRLVSGGRAAAGVVVPGQDRVGRRFPLSAFVIAPALPAPEALAPWGNAVAALLVAAGQGGVLPDDLLIQLEANAPPEGAPESAAEGAAMLLWRDGCAPLACDPGVPDDALKNIFSCSGSSSL